MVAILILSWPKEQNAYIGLRQLVAGWGRSGEPLRVAPRRLGSECVKVLGYVFSS